MAEHPILFSSAMVKAILEWRKTQTRRLVKPQPMGEQRPLIEWSRRVAAACHDFSPDAAKLELHAKKLRGRIFPFYDGEALSSPRCPYGQPGDELWVRETWSRDWEVGENSRGEIPAAMFYRATDELPSGLRWRSPIHMPRWASRLQLVIRDVRVQRLQEISAKEVLAEGAVARPHQVDGLGQCPVSAFDGKVYVDLRSLMQVGWDSLNSKRAPWASNPWVWAITFERKA